MKATVRISFLFILFSLLIACNPAEEQEESVNYELKLASYQPPGAAEAIATKRWADEIEKATDGKVKVKFYFQEGLLRGAEILRGVGDGRADMGYIADAYYPGELPLTNVAGLPFLTDDPYAQGKALVKLYSENEDFRNEWSKQNVHVLLWAPVPPNGMAFKKPIEKLEDLKGVKVRAIGYSAKAYAMAGMNPVAISQSEVYEALQRGVVDATSGGSLDILIDRSYQEVAPHFVDIRSGNYAVTANVINKKLWDSMPAELQAIINEVSNRYLDTYLDTLIEHEKASCEKLLSAGGTIAVLEDSDIHEWREHAKSSIYNDWLNDVKKSDSNINPEGFFTEYEMALQEFGDKSDYIPALQRCKASN